MTKTLLITGASKGIGLATVKEFMKKDESVSSIIMVARSSAAYDEAFNALSSDNPRKVNLHKYEHDLAIESDVEALLDNLKLHEQVQIIINNAGFTKPDSIQEIKMADFHTTIAVNLYAPFRIVQGLLMQQKFPETIINIASTAGMNGRSGWLTYSASKAAMINMSQVMKEELAYFGTQVVCLSPGRCATDLRKTLAPDEDPSTIMQPEDVAEIIRLTSSKSGLALDTTNIVVRR
jgi:3-oxoacyl-[acyl-carrier protein] reductase